MANLKKEVMSLISRFDAAQEAFSANSVEVKQLRKKYKKELKKSKAETKAALVEVEALKAELAIVRAGAPAKKATKAKRGPGRPKKAATTTAKRGPGRPKKAATAEAKPATAKRGPGRPKKATTAKPATGGAKRGPGRPRKTPAVPASPLVAIAGVGPAMAAKFEESGVKTPAALAKLSNVKMAAILAKCGPRYRNADSAKMQTYRDAAAAVKK
jgi:predicted flap endonuclease-1-like 5' DNA nuclease